MYHCHKSRNGASLEQRQEWMREVHTQNNYLAAPSPQVFNERHYSVAEISTMWNLSPDAVRRLFEDEPGVLVLGHTAAVGGRRRYTTLRIPESVVERVHRRLSVANRQGAGQRC